MSVPDAQRFGIKFGRTLTSGVIDRFEGFHLLESTETAESSNQKKVKLPVRTKNFFFYSIISVPIVMSVIFVVVAVHDVTALPTNTRCWKTETGPAWSGAIVDWMSSDYVGNPNCTTTVGGVSVSKTCCKFGMLAPDACWVYLCVLPIFWIIIMAGSIRIRSLTERGVICEFHEQALANANKAWKDSLAHDAKNAVVRHVCWLCLFQLVMGLVDTFLFVKTLRWIVAYQVVWLGFAACIIHVMPFIRYCGFLSCSMIDAYIERLMKLRDEGSISWSQLAEDHRTLELQLCALWIRVNLLTLLPAAPYYAMAALHFFCPGGFRGDEKKPDADSGYIVASGLIIFGSLVVLNRFSSIAAVHSMCNSGAAFKGKERSGQHSKMSIRAVVRSYIDEFQGTGSPNKSGHESSEMDKVEYMTFLEYLDNHDVTVHIGIPGICMVGITREMLSSTFFAIVVKLPLIISWLLAYKKGSSYLGSNHLASSNHLPKSIDASNHNHTHH